MNGPLGTIASAAPGVAMLGFFACLAGGAYLIAKRRDVKKGALMLIMAAVLLANVLIWTI